MRKLLYFFHPIALTSYYLIGHKLYENKLINKIQKSEAEKIGILNKIEILKGKIKVINKEF